MRRGSHPPHPPFAGGGKSTASGLFPPLRRGDKGGCFECLCVVPGLVIHAIENRSRAVAPRSSGVLALVSLVTASPAVRNRFELSTAAVRE